MPHRLSEREREILEWYSQGKTAWEIGKILGLSPRTIEWHVRNANKKLDVRNVTQAVAIWARQHPPMTIREKSAWTLVAFTLVSLLVGWIVPVPGPLRAFEQRAFPWITLSGEMVLPISFHSATTPSKLYILNGHLCRDHRDLKRERNESLVPLCKYLYFTPYF